MERQFVRDDRFGCGDNHRSHDTDIGVGKDQCAHGDRGSVEDHRGRNEVAGAPGRETEQK